VQGLSFMLAGDLRRAARELQRCADGSEDDGVTLSARLAMALLLLNMEDTDGLLAADSVARTADRLDLGFLSRLAGSVVAAWSGCRVDGRVLDVVGECDRRGDIWGAALAASAQAMVAFQTGRPNLVALEELVSRFRGLGAVTLEAWARAALAIAAAVEQCPDARMEAMAAESMARAAAVPGALSLSYAALAMTSPIDRDELRELAKASAHDAGMRLPEWLLLNIQGGGQVLAEDRLTPETGAEPWPLHIRCFGSFSLLAGDSEPDISRLRPRARAALRLLALHAGRPVHREMLIEALWPELDTRAAMHNLQVTMSSLRAALEPGGRRGASRLVARIGETYTLVLPIGSTSDLLMFDSSLASFRQVRSSGNVTEAIAHLRRAVRLYSGDVLPEDGPADWVVTTREHYRLRAAEAAGVLAEFALADEQARVAVEFAARSVAIDPFRDASWRVLVEAHVRAGDVAAAEQARRAYREVLTSLGVPDVPARRAAPLLNQQIRTV
jgi:DNA-binding SARP family transcriptional activator